MKKRGKKRKSVESITFYSLRELPYEYRRMPSFVCPHTGNQASLDLLKSYSIFFYRDSMNPRGLILELPPLKAVTSSEGIMPDEPFDAYVYQATTVQGKNGNIGIRERVLGEFYTPDALQLQQQRLVKYGDTLWWDRWAHKVSISLVTPFSVKYR